MNQAIYSLPRYAQIKSYIKNQIESQQWPVGERIPSENQLAVDFSVSRMTARRAVQELADEGLLLRSAGMGTFVAEPPSATLTLELPDFAQQFNFANPRYSNRVIELDTVAAASDIGSLLQLAEGAPVYYSVVVHALDAIAVQWEECFVSPALVPAYLKQNYQKVTPQAYLNWVLAPSRVEHQLRAAIPDSAITGALGQTPLSACLQITRRSWHHSRVISVSRSFVPGSSCSIGAALD
jgi:GntR family histidine utilization transcriptional repressor